MKKLRGKQKRRDANKIKMAGPHFPTGYMAAIQKKFEEAAKFDGEKKLTPFQQIAMKRAVRRELVTNERIHKRKTYRRASHSKGSWQRLCRFLVANDLLGEKTLKKISHRMVG